MASTEASTTDVAPETEERPIGFGRLRRKEDPRFIRGLGKFVDDIKLPGMLMTARALLDENPDPTDHEIRTAISGGICRCTGYKNIVAAARWAAEHERQEV